MKLYKVAFCFVHLSLFVGCSAVKNEAFVRSEPSKVVQEYKIQQGDMIDIKFFYNPELNEQLTVRPDGMITLQLVNEVVAAGRTPRELTEVLSKLFAQHLADPKVAVIIRTSTAAKVYVDGEVNRAGVINLAGPLTALQAISQAGGLKDSADPAEVIVLRQTTNGVKVYKINLVKVLQGGDFDQDIVLVSDDILYVPRTAIANVNLWVDKYLRKNVPLPVGVGYSIN